MAQDTSKTDVAIIGGGLAGLALARHLTQAGIDFQLFEARDRFGGRIKTAHVDVGYFDLGPAWFWPGQPRMAALAQDLGVTVFEQFATGALSFEDEQGRVERGRGFASMQGSLRVAGGLDGMIAALAISLPRDRLHLGARVTQVGHQAVTVKMAAGSKTVVASRIAIALPPRLAEAKIAFGTALDAPTRQAMQNVSTWMAGQAKVVAVYDRPFWREAGLSGDAMSRRGPLVEIHDASPEQDGPFALFGFVGIPAQARQDRDLLKAATVEQLAQLFGPEAKTPRDVFLKDWAFDANTATELDQAPVHAHPSYGMPSALKKMEAQGIHFCGTEVAPTFGGYLEGALEAAEIAARGLIGKTALERGQTC